MKALIHRYFDLICFRGYRISFGFAALRHDAAAVKIKAEKTSFNPRRAHRQCGSLISAASGSHTFWRPRF